MTKKRGNSNTGRRPPPERKKAPNDVDKLQKVMEKLVVKNVEKTGRLRLYGSSKGTNRSEYEIMRERQQKIDDAETREATRLRRLEHCAENEGAKGAVRRDRLNSGDIAYDMDGEVLENDVAPIISSDMNEREDSNSPLIGDASYSPSIDSYSPPNVLCSPPIDSYSPLIDIEGRPVQLDMRSFITRLRSFEFKKHKTEQKRLDRWDELLREEYEYHDLKGKCHGQNLGNYFTGQCMTEFVFRKPIVQIIMNSNSYGFFNLIAANIRDHAETESYGCFCDNETSLCSSFRFYESLNPLHVAAAYSTPEFVETIIDERFYRNEIMWRLRERPDAEVLLSHYEKIIFGWLKTPAHEGVLPADVAANENRIDVFKILVAHPGTMSWLNFSIQKRTELAYRDNLLSRLVQDSSLIHLDSDIIEQIVEHMSTFEVEYASDLAMSIGDMNLLNICKNASITVLDQKEFNYDLTHKKDAEQFDRKKIIPGLLLSNGSPLPLPIKVHDDRMPPAAHILAENGNFEAFQTLTVEQKQTTDFFGFSALVSLLGFSDDQVRSQLCYFRNANRADHFCFISEIIVTNRVGILEEALQIALTNPDNFRFIRTEGEIYKMYGLPDYISLPMETALERNGDMQIVEMISQVYSRQEKFTRMMKEEDALRCIRLIQDRASRCTEHIRLAVIFMMLKFVDPFSESFITVMRMYLDQGMMDIVAEYVLDKYSKLKSERFEEKRLYIPWTTALSLAREEVATWSGSLEDDDFNSNLLSEAKDCSPPKDVQNEMPRSILMTKERKEEKARQRKKAPRTEENVMAGLARAIAEIERLKI